LRMSYICILCVDLAYSAYFTYLMYFFDKVIKTAQAPRRIVSVNEEFIAVIVCRATAGISWGFGYFGTFF
jgi:hypothetical protein